MPMQGRRLPLLGAPAPLVSEQALGLMRTTDPAGQPLKAPAGR